VTDEARTDAIESFGIKLLALAILAWSRDNAACGIVILFNGVGWNALSEQASKEWARELRVSISLQFK